MGLVQGVCGACGSRIRRNSPVPMVVVCDCYRYCPICDAEMMPVTPDLSPRTYRNEDNPEWDPTESAERSGFSAKTLCVCYSHDPPEYSDREPVEVLLE